MSTVDPTTERRLFGRGLAAPQLVPGLDLGSDLAFAAGPGGTTLAQVEGVANLGQALRLALTTALGSHAFDVGYGFDGLNALAEESDPQLARERVRLAVIRTVRRDARVQRIADVGLARTPGTRTLAVSVTLETASARPLTLTIGEVPSNG